jgi:hypothetical protein
LPSQVVNFVWLHFKKDLENAPEIVERDRGKLNLFPDPDSVQIAKGGHLRVSGSPPHLVTVLQQEFGQISAVLP